MHGVAGVVHRIWSGAGFKMPKALAWLLTFLFLNTTWVFFRALDFHSALKVLKGMININSLYSAGARNIFRIPHLIPRGRLGDILPWFVIFILTALIAKNSNELTEKLQPNIIWAMVSLILLLMGMPDFQQPSEFLYFNF